MNFRSFRLAMAVAALLALAVTAGLVYAVRAPDRPETTTRLVVHADVDSVTTAEDLARRASLVVSGVPVGQPAFEQTAELGGDFVHRVRVTRVLKGDAPGEIRIVRFGMTRDPRPNEAISDPFAGPLPTGPGIYFLEPSARDGVYQVVGHSQGTLLVGPEGRVVGVERGGFPGFVGLTEDQVDERVDAAAR
ncbi:MAG: hypothetical protein M3321_06805 [Actinomycetota bacterium]|nr:hypothetical protein [Actinomycetota bacterium]